MTMESTMELDDLKQAWQTLDRRLQQQNAISLQLLTDSRVRTAKSSLRWPLVRSAVQIALGVALTIFFALFWIGHRDNAMLMVSGLVMHAYSVMLIIAGVMELLLLIRIDYAAPVVTIQRYLTLYRQWRNRSMPWLGLSQWLLWIPETLIVFKAWLGIDLWANAHAVVYIFLAIGAAGLLGSMWLVYWSPAALRGRVGCYLDETNAGPAVMRAQASLDEIARFERE
jgi:hypothetical protein